MGSNLRVEITTAVTGRVVKDLTLNNRARLSDVVDLVLKELGVKIKHSDLEPYYLVVVNGNQLAEGVKWSEVIVGNEDYVVILPLAFGGTP